MKKLSILLLFCLVLVLGCARYHTRLFLVLGQKTPPNEPYRSFDVKYAFDCGRILVYPDVYAYINSFRVDTKKDNDFGITLYLVDTSSDSIATKGTGFVLDAKLSVNLGELDKSYKLRKKESDYVLWSVGRVWELYFGAITIPNKVDTINISIEFNINDIDLNYPVCDSLKFVMYRFESSSFSIWVGD